MTGGKATSTPPPNRRNRPSAFWCAICSNARSAAAPAHLSCGRWTRKKSPPTNWRKSVHFWINSKEKHDERSEYLVERPACFAADAAAGVDAHPQRVAGYGNRGFVGHCAAADARAYRAREPAPRIS